MYPKPIVPELIESRGNEFLGKPMVEGLIRPQQ